MYQQNIGFFKPKLTNNLINNFHFLRNEIFFFYFRVWSAHTFKLCEALWRNNEMMKELEGLEDLRQAVSLLPAFDLFDSRHVAEPESEDSWTSTVYDYRFDFLRLRQCKHKLLSITCLLLFLH